MTDIVKRIREGYVWVGALQECADEIERLNKTIDDMEAEYSEIGNWKQREIERLRLFEQQSNERGAEIERLREGITLIAADRDELRAQRLRLFESHMDEINRLREPLKIEVCRGQAGVALYVNDTRIAGPSHNGRMQAVLTATYAPAPKEKT